MYILLTKLSFLLLFLLESLALATETPNPTPHVTDQSNSEQDHQLRRQKSDAFGSGSSLETIHQVESGKHYIYKRSKSLNSVIRKEPLVITIPKVHNGDDHRDHDMRRLRTSGLFRSKTTIEKVTTFAGEGGASRVYFMHPVAPHSISHGSEDSKNKWAQQNAKEVIKVRKYKPWGADAEAIKRDLELAKVFQKSASQFKYIEGGKKTPLIEAVPYSSSKREIAIGLLKQEIVRGDSVHSISDRIRSASAGSKVDLKYLTETLKFKDLESARNRTAAVEEFYRKTNEDALKFHKLNNLTPVRNKNEENKDISVGFDFNHGHNVIWDPKKQIFRAIDY
ncbi:MAG: hypothetical protein ABIQ95_12115 [Bdellovibrionia bacterium]